MVEPRTNPNHCISKRRDGNPCMAPAATERGLCIAHDPDLRAKREAARRKGGENRSQLVRLHAVLPPRLLPVYSMLEGALGEVHDGSLAPAKAQAMASLGRALVAVLQSGELEARVRALEAERVGGKKS